jgi:hypothetical protein
MIYNDLCLGIVSLVGTLNQDRSDKSTFQLSVPCSKLWERDLCEVTEAVEEHGLVYLPSGQSKA